MSFCVLEWIKSWFSKVSSIPKLDNNKKATILLKFTLDDSPKSRVSYDALKLLAFEALTQMLAKDTKKSFEYVHYVKVYWKSPATPQNSSTVYALL